MKLSEKVSVGLGGLGVLCAIGGAIWLAQGQSSVPSLATVSDPMTQGAGNKSVGPWVLIGLGVLLIVAALVIAFVPAVKKMVDGDESADDAEGYEGYGEDDIIDMDDLGIEEGSAMRSGLERKSAPYSGPDSTGQPGDYGYSGRPADVVAELAAENGLLGADIPEDELAAWTGLQNPGASETMIISHGDLLGIDTVGQTKRNMTRDLRGEPIIPPKFTSPFGQSTITRGDLDNTYLKLANG